MYPSDYHSHSSSLPCLHCHASSYIRMVQHLIERCLLLHMTRDACVGALAHHANIPPTVTLIVWAELIKENRAFFKSYFAHAASTRFLYQRKQHRRRRRRQRRLGC